MEIDERSSTELFMAKVLRDGKDIETLIENPGWKLLIRELEQEAIDSWLALKDVDPYDSKEIARIQSNIHSFAMLLEKAAGFLQAKRLITDEQPDE